MKFGMLIECNTRKYSGETSPRPFSENSKLSVSLDQQSEIL